jgi:hypothetical protein
MELSNWEHECHPKSPTKMCKKDPKFQTFSDFEQVTEPNPWNVKKSEETWNFNIKIVLN